MASPKSREDRAGTLLRERVRRVFRELPGALVGEEEPVHQVRVAGRRLRVALPLLARKPEGRRVKRARRILARLTRAAGTGRDLDVLVGLLEEHLGGLESTSAAQREVLGRLRAARTRSRRRMVGAVLDVNIDRLRQDLRTIRARGPAAVSTILERSREAREEEGAALLQGLAQVGDRYDPEALHALRRRVRRLRYTAEVDDAIRGQKSEASPIWKRLQEGFGTLHDVHVLALWLDGQVQWAEGRGRRALAEAAGSERRAFVAKGHRLHRALLETRPSELVAQALDAMARGQLGAGEPSGRPDHAPADHPPRHRHPPRHAGNSGRQAAAHPGG